MPHEDHHIVVGGACKTCGHGQGSHEGNTGCSECDCEAPGSY